MRIPCRFPPTLSAVAAAVFAVSFSHAGEAKEKPSNLGKLRKLVRQAKAGPGALFSMCSAAEDIRFRADDPELPEAAAVMREIAAAMEATGRGRPGWSYHSKSVERIRRRAEELEAGIVTVPPVWDESRLREAWIVTARARGDIDGDGKNELFVGIRHGEFLWCHLLGYERSRDRWELFWERRFPNFGCSLGVYKLEFRDFDGDGRAELLAGIDDRNFGTGGGGGTRRWLFFAASEGRTPRMRCVLALGRKNFAVRYRGRLSYDELCGEMRLQDAEVDGHRDVLVRYTHAKTPEGTYGDKLWESDAPARGLLTRRLIREDRYRWRDGRYCHDKEALRADYDGLVARARAMPPEAGLEFAERVEFDFIGSHGPIGAHLRRLAWTAGLPRVDIDFVEAEHLLALGRSDEAYETLMAHSRRTVLEGSVATRAGVLEHLGRICEERFAAPKEAADFYERAIAAGAREAELGPRIMALKDDAARLTHRPLRPGELAGCSPRELRVIERIPVAHGLQHVRSAAWSPDGRRLLVCGREQARGGYSAFVIDSAGGEIRRIGPAEAAAWCGRGDAVLTVMKIKTPHGKLRYELRTTSDEAAARPWPDDLRGRPGAVSVSPGGNSFAATVGLAGCDGEGIAVVMSHRGSPPREVLVRHDHWSSVDALVGWRKASELVVRVCGEVKVYDAGARTWRGMSASRLGPGRYEQWLSPTGTHIAYARNRDMHGSRLYVARPNGGEPSLVDFEWRYARGYGEPRWSPDGTKLLVKSAGRDARSGDTTYTLSVLVLGRRVARSAPAGIAHSRR